MKVPHQVSGLRPSGQPLSYLRSSVSPATFGAGRGQALARAGTVVAGLGSTVEAAAQVYEERQNKARRFGAEREFTEFQSRVSEQLTELKRNTPPDAANFVEQAEALYGNLENEFIGNRVPPELQDEFRVRTGQVRTGIVNDSLSFQYEQQDEFFRQGLKDEFTQAQLGVEEDTAKLEEWGQRIDELAETTDLSEIEKEELRRQMRAGLASVAYKKEYEAQKLAPTPEAGASFVDKVVQVESGGNPRARAKTSSARGLGQFTTGTWNQFLAERHPGLLSLGRDLRDDPELSREAVAWYGEKNGRVLAGAGLPVTDGTLYLAHFLGPQGAVDMLSADPVMTAASVNPAAAKSNRSVFYKRNGQAKSVGELVSWATQKMGGAAPSGAPSLDDLDDDPRFASIPYEDRLALRKDGDAAVARLIAAETKAAKELYDQRLNTLFVGIHDGQMGQAHIDSWREQTPDADYNDIKKAQDALDKRDEDLKWLREGQEKLGSATAVFDPMDTDDKKRLNALFGDAGKARVSALDADYFTGAVVPIVERTGDIPTDVVGLLQGMMRSNDQQRAVFALDALAQLEEADARAFAHRVPDAVASDVRLWRTRKDYYPRDELMKLINGGLSSQERQQREMLVKEAESLLKDLDPTEAIDVIEGIVLRRPGFGPRPHAERAFTLDYQNLFIEEYTRYGDEDEARDAAIERLGRVWGVTEVGGKSTLMKYPPEKAGYRPVNGGYEWIDEQVRDELGMREGEGFQLIADDQTREEFSKGVPPSYRMIRVDENGVYSLPEDEEGLPVRMNFAIPQEYVESEAQRLQLSKQLSIYRDKYTEFSQARAHSALTGVPIPDEVEAEMVAVREAIRELRPIIATHERGLDQELIRVMESIMTDTFLGAP